MFVLRIRKIKPSFSYVRRTFFVLEMSTIIMKNKSIDNDEKTSLYEDKKRTEKWNIGPANYS